jgi:hypothetical protein
VSGLQPPSTKPIEAFDAILKSQGQFWCPICNLWMDSKLCQTIIEHPQLVDGKVFAHILFGMCEKCLDSLKGHDPVDAARIAMAERSAKGVAEIPDRRIKFFVMRKKQA